MSELAHYGIPGMKWGVRKKRNPSGDAIESSKIRKKHVSEMSNDELRKLNNRQELERKYAKSNPKLRTRAVQKGKQILAVAGTAVAVYNLATSPAGKAAVSSGKKVVDNVLAKYTIDFVN